MPTIIRDHLEETLAKISLSSATNVFTKVYTQSARDAADACDARLADGQNLGPLDGMIVSIKECLPVAGEVTTTGGAFTIGDPASADQPEVAKLRQAGAIIIGKTAMTEYGIDPIGIKSRSIPLNTFDPNRVTGGSTSGGSVSVALDLCTAALGTDTVGSIRIPAAWHNLVGMVATSGRIPRFGRPALSFTQGSVGNIARSVGTVANVDAVMTGVSPTLVTPPVGSIRVGVARGLPFSSMTPAIASQMEAAISRISSAGATVTDTNIDTFLSDEVMTAITDIAMSEAYYQHQGWISAQPNDYLPYVRTSISYGSTVSASAYIAAQRLRQQMRRNMRALFESFDVLIVPTVRFYAPLVQAMMADDDLHALTARRTMFIYYANSFCNLPGITIPLPGLPSPAGLMLMAKTGNDRVMLGIASSLENLIRNG